MSNILDATVRQLAYKIKDTKGYPRFAFFLGAGASRQSGIITASEMVVDFKKRLIAELCPDEVDTDERKYKWLTEQNWYPKGGTEYCKLFEKLEPKEYGRRTYIQRIVGDNQPSFGYAVLANLLASNYINTIITTNFDDLIYSACSIYTGIRPIVYAYGLLAAEMRIAANQPKVLKLHGDYLYSMLKNTEDELKDQDPNMRTQVVQVLGEYGLVVIGYGGGDKSVMNILEEISPKNDLYWCIPEDSEINKEVETLLDSKHGSLIRIKGFDEMMNEIRMIVGFDVRKMFGSIRERQDFIIEQIQDFADKYSVDILAEIVEALQEENKLANEGAEKRINDVRCLDLSTQARKARRDGDSVKAETLYRQVIDINPSYKRAHNDLGIILQDLKRYDEAKEAYRKETEVNKEDPHAYSNLMKLLRSQGKNAEALEIAEKALRRSATTFETFISLVGIHRSLGNTNEADMYAIEARKRLPPNAWYHLASLECLLGNKEMAIKNLERASEEDEDFDRPYAKKDPDFESIRNDPRFKVIVGD